MACFEITLGIVVVFEAGMIRAENVRRVELISSLLAEILTAGGDDVLVEVRQFDLIIDLLFQVITRYHNP